VVQDRNAPQKHVWRAEIVLLTADGVGTNAIMRRTGKSKTCVWRWQERFHGGRVRWPASRQDAPVADTSPLGAEQPSERSSALTLARTARRDNPLTGALMAKPRGFSLSSVQRMLRTHGSSRTVCATSSFPKDPRVHRQIDANVVGLYVDPPAQPSSCPSTKRANSGARPHAARTAMKKGAPEP